MKPPSAGPITGAISPGHTMRPIASMMRSFGVSREHDEAPDGRHERRGHALQQARGQQRAERRARAAQERGEREHGDGPREEVPRAEALARPGGRRHEHRHGDEIDGDARREVERGFAEALRHRRKRGRDDRRVQRFHEEGRRDDEGNAPRERVRGFVDRHSGRHGTILVVRARLVRTGALSERHLERVGDRQAVAVVYRLHHHIINVFSWRGPRDGADAAKEATIRGFHVVTWSDRDLDFAAVSDTDSAELKRFTDAYRAS